MIFMKFLERNSRATGPKMRVPFGLPEPSRITTALESKRRYEPSLRRIGAFVLTTTAFATVPFLTAASGVDDFNPTTIT